MNCLSLQLRPGGSCYLLQGEQLANFVARHFGLLFFFFFFYLVNFNLREKKHQWWKLYPLPGKRAPLVQIKQCMYWHLFSCAWTSLLFNTMLTCPSISFSISICFSAIERKITSICVLKSILGLLRNTVLKLKSVLKMIFCSTDYLCTCFDSPTGQGSAQSSHSHWPHLSMASDWHSINRLKLPWFHLRRHPLYTAILCFLCYRAARFFFTF